MMSHTRISVFSYNYSKSILSNTLLMVHLRGYLMKRISGLIVVSVIDFTLQRDATVAMLEVLQF